MVYINERLFASFFTEVCIFRWNTLFWGESCGVRSRNNGNPTTILQIIQALTKTRFPISFNWDLRTFGLLGPFQTLIIPRRHCVAYAKSSNSAHAYLMVGKFERQRPFLEPSEFTNHLQRTR
jgi:hypothetical protein